MNSLQKYAKLQAIYTRSIQPIAARAHNRIFPHARILVGVSLHGYPTTLQAFRISPLSAQAPSVHMECVDPRKESQHMHVLQTLERELERYFQECRAIGTSPQIWIPNSNAYRHWEAIADRLLQRQRLPKLCSMLQYLTQRYHYGGSQSLLILSKVLRSHWVTGQSDFFDESLATWNIWLGSTVDDNMLHKAQSEDFYTSLPDKLPLSPIDPQIQKTLRNESQKRLSLLRKTLSLFYKRAPTLISSFSYWWEQELEYFSSFMRKEPVCTKDSRLLAAQKLEERAFSLENHLADQRRDDPLFFYAGIVEGYCIEGSVHSSNGKRMQILCTQSILRAREGDTLSLRKDPSLQFRVLDREITPTGVLILLEKTYGSFYIKIGRTLQLSPSSTGWGFQHRRRQNIAQRMAQRGWIHREHS